MVALSLATETLRVSQMFSEGQQKSHCRVGILILEKVYAPGLCPLPPNTWLWKHTDNKIPFS